MNLVIFSEIKTTYINVPKKNLYYQIKQKMKITKKKHFKKEENLLIQLLFVHGLSKSTTIN